MTSIFHSEGIMDEHPRTSKVGASADRVAQNSVSHTSKESHPQLMAKASIYNSPVSVMDIESLKATEDGNETQIAPVNAMSLSVGAPVRLLDNDSTRNRVPHLVNTIGYIKEVPVHPATWFKVEFPNEHKVLTFRPSALQPVDENGQPLTAVVPKTFTGAGSTKRSPEFHGQRSRSNSAGSFLLPSAVTAPIRRSATTASNKKQVLLSNTDPETWIGRRVTVLTGRVKGVFGTVISMGNGWVQLESLISRESIAKRAAELALTPDYDHDTSANDNDEEEHVGRHNKRLFGRFVQHSERISPETKRIRYEDYTQFARDISIKKPAPVVVYKRPNLQDWQVKLNAALFLPSANNHTFGSHHSEQVKTPLPCVENTVHHQQSNVFKQKQVDWKNPVCTACNALKWPGAKFCWNETCAASPIFVERFEKMQHPPSTCKIKSSPSVEELQKGFEVESHNLQRDSVISSPDMMHLPPHVEDSQMVVDKPAGVSSDSSTVSAEYCDEDDMDDGSSMFPTRTSNHTGLMTRY